MLTAAASVYTFNHILCIHPWPEQHKQPVCVVSTFFFFFKSKCFMSFLHEFTTEGLQGTKL